MASTEIKATLDLEMKITLELSLAEARALNAITTYGSKPFLEGYYKQLGKSYLKPHEQGVVSLFETIKQNLPFKLTNANEIIKAVNSIRDKLNK